MKKILAVIAALALVVGVVMILQTDAPSPSGASVAGKGGVYFLNFKPEQAAQWQAVGETYTQLTGVPVTVVTAASGTYEDALRSEMAKNDPPTLFQVNGPVGLKAWRDYCLDLSDTAMYRSLQSDEFALKNGEEVAAVAYAIETYGIIYNKTLLGKYCALDGAVIRDASEINNFETLKAVAEDIQSRKEELGVLGAFTSAGMDASSDWRFKTHLVNLPLYYEYRDDSITDTAAIRGDYLPQMKQIWDLYIHNATCPPALIGAKTGEDAASEFALGEAVFYQNGTWAYEDVIAEGLTDDELGMLPIYIGAEGEEQQGLCTGSENYWCINSRAAPEAIEATIAFVDWLATTQEGQRALTDQLGLTTPFASAVPSNALQAAAQQDLQSGRTPVKWVFPTIPSDRWKTAVGAAMLEYAQGGADWDAVEKAFVEGWAAESAAQ
ncbi:MAG: ABC transporter substrate-binding protein [Clostridia bacterium]|nr:ABC transporter substrate-binding protein [Clostridia bacterium]